MKPPAQFLKKLRAYDPDLQVVWSASRECWLIERKIRHRQPCAEYPPGLTPDPEVLRRMREGYIHVGNVAPTMLDERVLLTLWQNDMWAHGGAKAVNALLDDYYATKDQREAATQRDDLKHLAGEMWDYIAWRRRGRIVVPAEVRHG